MKAEVISKSEKEHVVVLGGHEIGTSKHRFDADLHANVINNALAKRPYGLVNELEREIIRLNEELRLWKFEFRLWRDAWLRHLGGYIVRKSHEIDGFGLRHEQQLKEEYKRGCEDTRRVVTEEFRKKGL